MNGFWILVFAVAAGFTASGIVASLYRLSGYDSDSTGGWLLRHLVLVVAGPTVLFETAVRGYAKKEWTAVMFWLAICGLSYWSFAIGLLVLDLALRF